MKVLGIDPGTNTSGYGLVKIEGNKLSHVISGQIINRPSYQFQLRLKNIYDGLKKIIDEYSPDLVAIENIFHAKNIQSALKLGHARGVAILAAVNSGIYVYEYTPLQIKTSVVGYGGAEKEQVQKMVKEILNLPQILPEDESDALAVAICHINSSKIKNIIEGNI